MNVLRKTLFLAVAAAVTALAVSSDAEAWGVYHAGYTHYSPYTGVQHYGYTAASRGVGGYGGIYRSADYRYGNFDSAYRYGGYHYGGYGGVSGGAARYGYYRRY
jgi:hypothetical protein